MGKYKIISAVKDDFKDADDFAVAILKSKGEYSLKKRIERNIEYRLAAFAERAIARALAAALEDNEILSSCIIQQHNIISRKLNKSDLSYDMSSSRLGCFVDNKNCMNSRIVPNLFAKKAINNVIYTLTQSVEGSSELDFKIHGWCMGVDLVKTTKSDKFSYNRNDGYMCLNNNLRDFDELLRLK